VNTPSAQVTIQIVQTPASINPVVDTSATPAVSQFDVPSAVQSLASSALSQTAGTTVVRVLVAVTPQAGPVVIAQPFSSRLTAASVPETNEQPAPQQGQTQPLPPSVVVPNPLINFTRNLWVADQPPNVQTNFLAQPEEVPAMPGNDGQVPPANPVPAIPPLPPVIHYGIPLAQADYSEPRVVVTAVTDESATEPMEQRLEAPILPPVTEENSSPSSPAAGLPMALLGFPCAVAAERQRREFYRDRQRDDRPWLW